MSRQINDCSFFLDICANCDVIAYIFPFCTASIADIFWIHPEIPLILPSAINGYYHGQVRYRLYPMKREDNIAGGKIFPDRQHGFLQYTFCNSLVPLILNAIGYLSMIYSSVRSIIYLYRYI